VPLSYSMPINNKRKVI